MTEENKPDAAQEQANQPQRISLADAMKRKLEQKKQAQAQAKGGKDHFSTETKKMKSQINKKPNNQKKRTGV
ncbi:hypothetical protein COLU111180_20685 [Cohnella lubricantis]|uniref:DUF5302 domain-containing protein n=1 Tax=Cohnella lubricantis TaxID=2163172 RepID=A0A841TDE3_9BACL|nr:hypothetical protein [Cohnella lubricantis]MBB6679052.1 hypothetical protein [Cohnella lubricantis]MBP2117139.1 hypothetical protein [Cohnella lubricantis]